MTRAGLAAALVTASWLGLGLGLLGIGLLGAAGALADPAKTARPAVPAGPDAATPPAAPARMARPVPTEDPARVAAPDGPARRAGGYPDIAGEHVNDFVGVLSAAEREELRQRLIELRRDTAINLSVVTMRSFRDYGTGDTSIHSFGANLLDRGDEDMRINGVILLVALRDRRCRVELGEAYGRTFHAAIAEVVDGKMIPLFRQRMPRQAILQGVNGVIAVLLDQKTWFGTYGWYFPLAALVVGCVLAGRSYLRTKERGWGWSFFIVLLFPVVGLYRLLVSARRNTAS